MNTFKALLLEEDGQGMVEYILIIAVVALVVVGGIKLFGDKLKGLFDAGKVQEIYPSHERYSLGRELLDELHMGISNIEGIWDTKQKDRFLHAWILEDSNFKYVI